MEADGAASGADLLMSHFVSSEFPDDPINAVQIERFDAARAAFPSLPASLANSSGMFLGGRPSYDLARPGYALYGGNPTPGAANPMRPVVTLAIAIQQTRSIEAGMTCGYNAQWTAKRRTRLATLLAGYADGLPRGAGATDSKPGAEVAIAGRRCPLVGRVSMDLTIADVTDLPENAAQPGDLASSSAPRSTSTNTRPAAARSAITCLRALGKGMSEDLSHMTTQLKPQHITKQNSAEHNRLDERKWYA